MSQAEHGKLLEGWDASDVDAKIEALDFNIEQGRKPYISYENHYAAVRGWLKKDCTPRTRPGDLEIKPDTNRPVLQEGMSWAEILDAQ